RIGSAAVMPASGAGGSAGGYPPGEAGAGSAAARPGGQRNGGSARRSQVIAADADDPRPLTDAVPAGEDAGDLLTGTDLIERELGGRVIGEIGES
ncbi:MAG TPA: hypothetical protein VN840_08630, partial [Streptosporangiaceae bacterium]|nr:hypothetical protein [Streptosporangiaceae bacterium]